MSSYIVFRADFQQDRAKILDLIRRNLPEMSERIFAWNESECPFGPAHRWLATLTDESKPIATCALLPRRIMVNGQLLTAGFGADFTVDREYRGFGPALRLQKTLKKEASSLGLPVLYGMPIPALQRLLSICNYQVLGRYKKYIKILKAEYKNGHYLLPRWLARTGSRAIEFALWSVSRERRYKKLPGYTVDHPRDFDERFNKFWTKVSPGFSMLGLRNADFLTWRFLRLAYRDYRIFCLLDESKNLAGYVVYVVEENSCRIADLLFINNGSALDALLAEFILYMRQQGVGSLTIQYFGGNTLSDKLRAFQFLPHTGSNLSVMGYWDSKFGLQEILGDPGKWYILDSDTDEP